MCEKCRSKVVRELNSIADCVRIRLEASESVTEFASDFTKGQIKGAIAAMKDMQDIIATFSERLEL